MIRSSIRTNRKKPSKKNLKIRINWRLMIKRYTVNATSNRIYKNGSTTMSLIWWRSLLIIFRIIIFHKLLIKLRNCTKIWRRRELIKYCWERKESIKPWRNSLNLKRKNYQKIKNWKTLMKLLAYYWSRKENFRIKAIEAIRKTPFL